MGYPPKARFTGFGCGGFTAMAQVARQSSHEHMGGVLVFKWIVTRVCVIFFSRSWLCASKAEARSSFFKAFVSTLCIALKKNNASFIQKICVHLFLICILRWMYLNPSFIAVFYLTIF